jgi:hypothetical protein
MLAILAFAALGLLAGRFVAQGVAPVQAQADVPTGINVRELESRMGLAFVPADPARTRAAITKDRAIAIAQEKNAFVEGARGVAAELGHLSKARQGGVSVAGLDRQQLIWFVRFQGVESRSSGPPDRNGQRIGPVGVSNSYTVVVDATTGQILVGMTS